MQTPGVTNGFVQIGKTEAIQNNNAPSFKTTINATYCFEKDQKVKFEVNDDDGGNNFDIIGHVETTMANIMGSRGQTFTADLTMPGKEVSRGKIIVRAESLNHSNKEVSLQFSAMNLLNKTSGCGGMCEEIIPMIMHIRRATGADGKTFNNVWSSQVMQGTVNPVFPAFSAKLMHICNSNEDLPIRYVYSTHEGRDIGYAETTIAKQSDAPLLFFKRCDNDSPAGELKFSKCQVVEKPSFVEILQAGWQLSLAVAIDYTASNGNGDRSLHAQNENNQYFQAIS
jgi:hypothetical protein